MTGSEVLCRLFFERLANFGEQFAGVATRFHGFFYLRPRIRFLMKKISLHSQHKWFGIGLCLFLVLFSLSGILLNHREVVSGADVSRKFLPKSYRFSQWNNGLLKGTLVLREEAESEGDFSGTLSEKSASRVLIYGAGGLWLTDSLANSWEDFNQGLPSGADLRNIRAVVQMPKGEIFAVGSFGLFKRRLNGIWQEVKLPKSKGERLSDLTSRGDTLVVLSRSHVYLAPSPYISFEKIELRKQPLGPSPSVSLFRTLWLLHSGELLGFGGKLVADAVALVFLFLAFSGLFYWLVPTKVKLRAKRMRQALRSTRLLHEKAGRFTIVLTFLVCLTGWCLRPPLMVPLVLTKTRPLPLPSLGSVNPWQDKLRMIRFDDSFNDWIISTSDGFYALRDLKASPKKLSNAPPVSVMGLNVWQKDSVGYWLCGSFSGLYEWSREWNLSCDFFTGLPPSHAGKSPFGEVAISGFSADFSKGPCVVTYGAGTQLIPQPESLSTLPMSLWNVALEVHSGRIFFGSAATFFFIFLAGGAILWCLWSGWLIRRKRPRGKGGAPAA